jgi:two-component system, NtrC family, sensor kinase
VAGVVGRREMIRSRLSVKLIGAVGGVALVAVGVLAWMNIRAQRAQLMGEVVQGASRFSDTVRQSTRHAMLQNQWSMAYRIMDAIAAQDGVDRVRVFNKEGQILFSTDRAETGKNVDKRAESCYACHAAERPLERLQLPQRTRVFRGPGGDRVLGMITPIYNEPTCSQAACHAHAADKRVLGVLDVALSLKKADAQVRAASQTTALQTAGFAVLLVIVMAFLMRRQVVLPVADVLEGTRKVAGGDLSHRIPVRSSDEIGQLADSFNAMTTALQRTSAELAQVVANLEVRVEERTRELREAQEKLVQTEKLASMGKLSASVAHEINNPLAGVLTYAKLLTRKLRKGPPDAEGVGLILRNLALIERETERCSTIVKNLLDFARQREPALRDTDLNTVLSEVLALINHRLEMAAITQQRELGELPVMRADHDQLRQVFLNITMNACDAMGRGGTLTVRSRLLPAGKEVEVEVADTGPGILPEHLGKIFDPFFTTKEKGTGLGLSVVYGIVQRHGGTIEVRCPPEGGTVFVTRLPLQASVPEAAA